jgi:hypothetical protein
MENFAFFVRERNFKKDVFDLWWVHDETSKDLARDIGT